MKIELSNGYAVIKDYYPRKIEKEVKKILFRGVELSQEGGTDDMKSVTKGYKFENADEANDYAIMSMLEELFINGKKEDITIDALDCMPVADYNKIKDAIDLVAKVETADKKK